MNTKQIDYCIELARTQNFSRGAENMFVSQPTFSYQIKLLEEEVGFAIFERNGRGASLTPAGKQFVSYLSLMREELKRAIEQGQNFSAKYKDNISISLPVRQSLYFLPEEHFSITCPKTKERTYTRIELPVPIRNGLEFPISRYGTLKAASSMRNNTIIIAGWRR